MNGCGYGWSPWGADPGTSCCSERANQSASCSSRKTEKTMSSQTAISKHGICYYKNV